MVPADTAAALSMPQPQVVDNWLVVLRTLIGKSNESTRFIPCHSDLLLSEAEIQQSLFCLEKLWSGVRRLKAQRKKLG